MIIAQGTIVEDTAGTCIGLRKAQARGLLSKSLFAGCEAGRPRGSCRDITRDGAARGAPSYYRSGAHAHRVRRAQPGQSAAVRTGGARTEDREEPDRVGLA